VRGITGNKELDWTDSRQSITAFVTIILMPLTYSIAYGIIAGLMTYTVMFLATTVFQFLSSPKKWKSVYHNFVSSKNDYHSLESECDDGDDEGHQVVV